MSAELWRPVPGYEGRYEVSDLGRVRSLDRVRRQWVQRGKKRIPRESVHRGRVLTPGQTAAGYLSVALSGPDGVRSELVHRLVLQAFSGEPEPGMHGRHLNGNPLDNRLSNLEWGTPKQNAADKARHGTEVRGSRRATARLTEQDIPAIFRMAAQGVSQREIAESYGVSAPTISCVLSRKTWRHVPVPGLEEVAGV